MQFASYCRSPPCGSPRVGTGYLAFLTSRPRRSFAAWPDEARFWPVISRPSVTLLYRAILIVSCPSLALSGTCKPR